MCREGRTHEAYNLAKADMEQQLSWAQREMGWVLYYLIKDDSDAGNYQSLVSHLDELNSLDQLSIPYDNNLFECVLYKVAEFVKKHLQSESADTSVKLTELFSKLVRYNFEPSRGYSFLLQSFIKCANWDGMADFIDWWNLDKLLQDDYLPFRTESGRSIMSLAERAYIAKSKALMRLNDLGRIEEFLPQMENLVECHPEMIYPNYFYGKLLLSLGRNREEALRVILPFARRKASEFWVWQLLGDVFADEPDKQMACLLRAVNSRTSDNYLMKVRTKLAALYIDRSMLGHAKYQIKQVIKCCMSNHWGLPSEIASWIHQPWIESVEEDNHEILNYMEISNSILCEGTEEAIAVVTQIVHETNKVVLVYGYQKSIKQKLRLRVNLGDVLKINYIIAPDGTLRILNAVKTQLASGLNYAKMVRGVVRKRADKDFAFLHTANGDYFMSPDIVNRSNIEDGMRQRCLAVYCYNPKKDSWDWKCMSVFSY